MEVSGSSAPDGRGRLPAEARYRGFTVNSTPAWMPSGNFINFIFAGAST